MKQIFVSALIITITGLGVAHVNAQSESHSVQEKPTEHAIEAKEIESPSDRGTIGTPSLSTVSVLSTQSARTKNPRLAHENEDDGDDDDDDDEENHTRLPVSSSSHTSTLNTVSTGQVFTLSQVSTHNTVANCYSAINGSVYNLTSFVANHPGGQSAIASLCGKDGSAAFNNQHGGQQRPVNELANFKIGTLLN